MLLHTFGFIPPLFGFFFLFLRSEGETDDGGFQSSDVFRFRYDERARVNVPATLATTHNRNILVMGLPWTRRFCFCLDDKARLL